MHLATTHGDRLASDLGLDPGAYELDLSGVRAGFGYEEGTDGAVTYRDLQARREVIRSRLQKRK